jgi:hypothetical protein
VKFGLQFDPSDVAESAPAGVPAAPAPTALSVATAAPEKAAADEEPPGPGQGPGQGGAEVVRLDRFRKK